MPIGLAIGIAVLLFDLTSPSQVPVFRRSHNGFVGSHFLYLNRERAPGRGVARVGYHPPSQLKLRQGRSPEGGHDFRGRIPGASAVRHTSMAVVATTPPPGCATLLPGYETENADGRANRRHRR